MLTLEEFIQLLKKVGQIKLTPPLYSQITLDFQKAMAHTRGVDLSVLLKDYRKTEDKEAIKRRGELLEPISKEVFDRATNDVIEILNPDLVQIESGDSTKEFMEEINFYSFLQDDVIPNMLDDPNGFLVALPKATSINQTTKPEIAFWIVNYKEIVAIQPGNYICFKKIIEDQEYYYYLNQNSAGRFIRNKEGTKEEYTIDTTYRVTFELQNEEVPFLQLGGQKARSKENIAYFQSYYSGAFAHATKAMQIFSDREAIRMRCNMVTLAQQIPCGTCEGTGTIIDTESLDHQEVECAACNGKGKSGVSWNIGDLISLESEFMKDADLENFIRFIDPPKEGLEMQDNLHENHLEKCEKALNMLFVDEAQSGVAKDIDKEHHTAMINTIAKNTFNRNVRFAYQFVEDTRGEKGKVSIHLPTDFRNTTSQVLLEKINDLKTKGATSGVLFPLYRKLYNGLYQNNPKSLKMALFSLTYDPLHIYSTIQEKRLACKDEQEFEYSKQLPGALEKLAYGKANDSFAYMTYEKIETEVDKLIALPEIIELKDDNGNPIPTGNAPFGR